jgi:methanogenic corrinoid protein MtbC1
MEYDTIKTAMAELDEDVLLEEMRKVADGDGTAEEALEACQKGMDEVGRLFEEGEYFVGDLIFAGEIMTEAVELIKPRLAGTGGGSYGKMLIATVKNDLHDIGKNIVKIILEAGGFDVLDLGTDVSPEAIVEAARENGIRIIALSGVLTLSIESMKETVDAFTAAGMRDGVKIVIGGAPITEAACERVGADAWTKSPQKALAYCREWAQNA